jgi:hypothetical protein
MTAEISFPKSNFRHFTGLHRSRNDQNRSQLHPRLNSGVVRSLSASGLPMASHGRT